MSEVENNLENLVRSMGVNIVDSIDGVSESEETQVVSEQVEETADVSADESDERSSVEEPVAEPVQEETSSEAEPEVYRYEQAVEETQESEDYTDEDVFQFVNEYVSNTYGASLDELINRQNNQTADIDERVLPILEFVQKTGRSPEDWFRYQSLNPSEMDDLTVVKMQMMSDFPELSADELGLLVQNKYKLDSDIYDESEIKMSQLQLKIDASKARKDIGSLRESYMLPVERTQQQVESQEVESIIDEQWISTMSMEADALDAIDFDLPGGKVFSFGLADKYRETLKSKNARLDEYFDEYVSKEGAWDFEKLNMHRTVLDNVDEIVKAVYQQGISDGQRRVVENTANIQTKAPAIGNVEGQDKVAEQLRRFASGNDNMMRIKF